MRRRRSGIDRGAAGIENEVAAEDVVVGHRSAAAGGLLHRHQCVLAGDRARFEHLIAFRRTNL